MSKILLLDNYDSFTYNLRHALEKCDVDVDVVRNTIHVSHAARDYDAICLSPGPGLPSEAGRMNELIQSSIGKIPILGVCLGMQALALHLGAELYNLKQVRHGVQVKIDVGNSVLFKGVGPQMDVGLYHSWAVAEESCEQKGNQGCRVSALSVEGVVMAIENADLRCWGFQFHPESVMTPKGIQLLKNFVDQIN